MENRGLTRNFPNSTLKLTSLLNDSRNFDQKQNELKNLMQPKPRDLRKTLQHQLRRSASLEIRMKQQTLYEAALDRQLTAYEKLTSKLDS